LVAKQLDAGTSMNPSTPVMPLEGSGTDSHWMQEDAHLARLLGGGAIPLTLLAQRAGATTANAGRVDHAQAAIGFSTLLMGVKRLPCWAPERPIGLERKV